ncbi:MAG: arginine--tRNA ligase [Candidatus Micrarchaeaceae archaeon]
MTFDYITIKEGISKALRDALRANSMPDIEIDNSIGISKGFGDFSCSIALSIGKLLGKDPEIIAKSIITSMEKPGYVSSIEQKNGFINFMLDRAAVTADLTKYILSSKGDALRSESAIHDKVIIEYPSVNPAHPWHVGHLRSALLGDVIANIHERCGAYVEREDYIDDLGLQATQAVWGYMHPELIESAKKQEGKFDHWLGNIYVEVNAKAKDEKISQMISETTVKIEAQGSEEARIAREVTGKCVEAYYLTSFDYGIYHDVLIRESDIVRENLLNKAVSTLKEKKIISEGSGKYENCTVIDFTGMEGLPKEISNAKEKVKVLVRSNGVPTYVAKDIAFHMWKFGMLENTFKYSIFTMQPNGKKLYITSQEGEGMEFGNMNKAINTIDARQSNEQAAVKFSIMKMEGSAGKSLMHVAYGVVDLETGHLAGRKGTWIGFTADELLAESEGKAAKMMSDRLVKDDESKAYIIRNIALSGIKFEFLKVSPEKRIIFSWSRALNFEGNSGPYCQYTHARASRLIEDSKAESIIASEVDFSLACSDPEFNLVKQLMVGRYMLEKAYRELRPNVITDYANDLAQSFSRFYESTPIMKADENTRNARLLLVLAFKYTMGSVLKILGIIPLERM